MSSWAVLQGSSLLFTKTQGSGTGWVSSAARPRLLLSVDIIKHNKLQPCCLLVLNTKMYAQFKKKKVVLLFSGSFELLFYNHIMCDKYLHLF